MFSDPKKNIEALGVGEGMYVVDLGVGSGYYANPLASAVGKHGKVFACDINRDILLRVKKVCKELDLNNVEIIWSDVEKYEGTHLRAESMDRVVISNILFQVADKEGVVKEAHRILKPNGKALVTDWSDPISPSMKVVRYEDAKNIFEKNGFVFEKDVDAGEHHWGMIFKK